MRPREPTDDERSLWDEHTKSDKRLKKNKQPRREQWAITAPSLLRGGPGWGLQETSAPLANPLPPPPKKGRGRAPEDLALGDVTHMDGRNAERFRKGRVAADATLDLHGMTRDEAHAAFRAFVLRCYSADKRRLLVITGKGRGSEPGVLKQALAGWVNDEAVRSHILAYDVAQPRHGGGGAFYIRLKKRT